MLPSVFRLEFFLHWADDGLQQLLPSFAAHSRGKWASSWKVIASGYRWSSAEKCSLTSDCFFGSLPHPINIGCASLGHWVCWSPGYSGQHASTQGLCASGRGHWANPLIVSLRNQKCSSLPLYLWLTVRSQCSFRDWCFPIGRSHPQETVSE